MEEERLAICEKCGIYNKTQNKCSSTLYIDPKTNNVSSFSLDDTSLLFFQ